MKLCLIFSILINLNFAYAADEAKLSLNDVLTWPQSTPADFGCFLEKELGHKDKKFNCGLKNYKNKGDPHKNTKEYYEGPDFPEGKASKIHKDIDQIHLDWERGELQNVSLHLVKKMTDAEVRKTFQLPSSDNDPRPNVKSISIDQCGLKTTCLSFKGFDHQGAADVEEELSLKPKK